MRIRPARLRGREGLPQPSPQAPFRLCARWNPRRLQRIRTEPRFYRAGIAGAKPPPKARKILRRRRRSRPLGVSIHGRAENRWTMEDCPSLDVKRLAACDFSQLTRGYPTLACLA